MDAPPPAARNAAERPGSYWQVTGAAQPTGALLRRLRERGFGAEPLAPAADGLVRILVGPCADAASLLRAKADLEAAGFRVVREW